jgi:hypothetical protein
MRQHGGVAPDVRRSARCVAAAAALATVVTAGILPIYPGVAVAAPAPCQSTPQPSMQTVTEPPWAQQRFDPDRLAGVVGTLAMLVLLVANVVPRGRRRGWRPGTG